MMFSIISSFNSNVCKFVKLFFQFYFVYLEEKGIIS